MTLLVSRRAVGREPHQLVFARIHLEAGVVGEGGVEQAETMGEMDLLVDRQVLAVADGDRRGGPLADAVQRQDGRLVERRRIERGGRVAQVVLAEIRRSAQSKSGSTASSSSVEQRLLEQLLAQPQRQRHPERCEAARAIGEIGLEQPLELEKWLVVEDDAVDVLEPDTCRPRGNSRSPAADSRRRISCG